MADGICPVGSHPFTYTARGTPTIYCSPEHRIEARKLRAQAARTAAHERWCPYGQHTAPAAEFSRYAPYCRPHMAAHARDRRAVLGSQDPAYNRMISLRRYGLTPDAFTVLLSAQHGKCAICRTSEPDGQGVWHVDHDHSCCSGRKRSCGKCIRGLLCSRCNVGIGNLKEDPAVLRAAAAYLEAYRDRRGATS